MNMHKIIYILLSLNDFTRYAVMKLNLKISIDNLKAYLSITEDKNANTQKPVTVEEIAELIKEKQIVYGINKDVISNIAEETEAVHDVLIAEGKEPTVGKSAELQFRKRPKRPEDVMPRISEDGDIDYLSPRDGWIVPVIKGEEITTKIPPTQGEPGMDIFGKEIPGIWGRDLELVTFSGINTEVQSVSLFSTIDGFVILQANRLNVQPAFQINGDVGSSTGSIEIDNSYDVEIIISKDITKGYWVKAPKITVGGCIEDCEIEANELTVAHGIVGTSDLPITAKKINTGYINGPRRIFAEDLYVNREISNGAQVFAKQIKAHTIQGSSVYAGEGIWTDYVNGQNRIMVGVDYSANQEYDKCVKTLKEVEELFEQSKKAMSNCERRIVYLKELSKKDPQHPLIAKELPIINEIKKKHEHLQNRIKELEEEKESLHKKMYPTENPFFLIIQSFSKDHSSGSIIEPNSIINIGHELIKIFKPSKGGLMTISQGKLKFTQKYNIKEVMNRLTVTG